MAYAHPGINSFLKYLKEDFPWKKDWDPGDIFEEDIVFTYLEVKQAIIDFRNINPHHHRLLEYAWLSNRKREEIANGLYMDSSTLKRSWNKSIHMIVNRLVNKDVIDPLEPIDLRLKKEFLE